MFATRSLPRTTLPFFLFALSASTSAQAGRVVGSLNTTSAGNAFGRQVISIGDVFGPDGVPDFVVSSPLDSGGAGKVEAFDGASLALKWSVTGTAGWLDCTGATGADNLGAALSLIADQSGDGIPDVLAVAPTAPVVLGGCNNPFGEGRVLNATNGNLVGTAAQPSNNPLVGSKGATVPGFSPGSLGLGLVEQASPGRIIVQDSLGSASGIQIGTSPSLDFSVVAGSFDMDGDGVVSEFVLGDPANDSIHIVRITYSSGLWGSAVLATVTGPAGSEFGAEIVGFDDTFDGLIVGAPGTTVGANANAGAVHRVQWNGTSFASSLHASGSQANDRLGSMLAIGGDVDADGKQDFLAAVPSRRRIQVHDLASGALGQDAFVTNIGLGTITSIDCAGGDMNGDAFEDFLVGVESTSVGGNVEGVRILSGGPTSTFNNNVGPGTGQGPAAAPALSTPLGFSPPTGVVTISGTVPNSTFSLWVGAPFPTGAPIVGYGTGATCFLDGSNPNFPIQLYTVGSTGASGTVNVPMPLTISLLGLEFGFQALVDQVIGGTTFQTVSNGASRVVGW